MLEGRQRTDGVAHLLVLGVPVDFGVVEVVKGLVSSYLLTIVDERHTIKRIGQHRERIAVVAVLLGQRLLALVVILVMVSNVEHTTERHAGRGIEHLVGIGLQGRGIYTITTVFDKAALECPGIVIVESDVLQTRHILGNVCLAEESDGLATLVALDKRNGRLPVRSRNLGAADVVAAVAVDVGLVNPELQTVVHSIDKGSIAIVQLIDIAVVVGMDKAIATLLVVFGMGGYPGGIGCRVVGNPVEPHLHALCMGSGNKGLQVGNGTIGRIGLLEVGSSVGAVNASATRIDGHEPDNINTQRLEFAELLLGSREGSGRGERADVHFVNHLTTCFSLSCGTVDVIDIVGGQHLQR